MSEQHKYEEECGCGHHHGEDGDCGCGHHHGEGEDCGCGHHHGEDGDCGCGHHHHGEPQAQSARETSCVIQGQMLGSSAVATGTVTVMAKYTEIEALTKKELQGLADWVISQNGTVVQMKSALVAIHSTMMAMTEDGSQIDSIVPEKEEIRVQFVAMADNISLEDIKTRLKECCESILSAAR